MSTKKRKNAAQRRFDRVRDAFDPQALIEICEMPQSAFTKFATRVDLEPAKGWRSATLENFYYFQDNGANILAVAHLDNVQDDRTTTITETLAGPVVFSGALDDRLGAYVILDLLPKLGIKVDVLLTTNEEVGASSAEYFETDKQYNWMIEFDRGGTDVVMYQYDSPDLRALVRDTSGAHVSNGSYSDIADLEHLGVVGFNWGVGYEEYHSERSHAFLEDTFRMVSRFMRFYATNAATHLAYVPQRHSYVGSYTGEWVGGHYVERYGSVSSLVDEIIDAEVVGNDMPRVLGTSGDPDELPLTGTPCPLCIGTLDTENACWECGYGVLPNGQEQVPPGEERESSEQVG